MIADLLFALYPALIFVGLQYLEARTIGVLLLVVLTLRYRNQARGLMQGLSGPALAGAGIPAAVGLSAVAANSEALLRLYPASISAGLLLIFGASLRRPPSMIERIARLREPDLPVAGVQYTRRVTKVWCLFFVINGTAAVYTAFYTSREIWALYNGALAYVLIGALFLGERLVRRHALPAP